MYDPVSLELDPLLVLKVRISQLLLFSYRFFFFLSISGEFPNFMKGPYKSLEYSYIKL